MTYDISRLRRLALISLVLQAAGRIIGRTKLQKIVYLANSIGWKAIDFKYHNYGPFSDSLAAELDNMKNYGWIEEREIPTSKDRVVHEYYFSNKYKQTGLSQQQVLCRRPADNVNFGISASTRSINVRGSGCRHDAEVETPVLQGSNF